MQNRFLTRQRLGIIAGCVFCACLAIAATADAAYIQSNTEGTASHMLVGQSSLVWTLSTDDLLVTPPLQPSQEIAIGGHELSMLAAGPAHLKTSTTLNNSDIVHQNYETSAQFGLGVLDESQFLFDVGAGSGVGCGATEGELVPMPNETNATTISPFCEMAITSSKILASNVNYASIGGMDVGAVEVPDSMGASTIATGDGLGILSFSAMSKVGFSNCTEMGYSNSFTDMVLAEGQFEIQQDVMWSSFKNTFDGSPLEGPEAAGP